MITCEMLTKANEQIKYIELKGGKRYAKVQERVKAFRAAFPDYSIITEIISVEGKIATFKAAIIDPEGRTIATGHAQEEQGKGLVNGASHLENCETSAVGRALANLGIGIDAEFASADEMMDSIVEEQNALIKAQEDPNIKVNKKQINGIIEQCANADITVADVCKFEGIETIEELTYIQYFTLTGKWTEIVKKIKGAK